MTVMEIEGLRADGLMHIQSPPDRYWSTTNIGEACPGTQTPLGVSIWVPSVDNCVRETFWRLGALSRDENTYPAEPSLRVAGIFYGRMALSATVFCEVGNRMPGTSGDAIAMQLLGSVPDGLPTRRDLSRMHHVAYRLPHSLAVVGREVHALARDTKAWWLSQVPPIGGLDLTAAQRALDDGRRRFHRAIAIQTFGVFAGVQPVYDQLLAVIDSAGLPPDQANALMAGQGSHAELEMVADLWAVSRERLTVEEFVRRHGYHGPREGDVMARVWREDPSPVMRLVERYAARPDDEDPLQAAQERTRARVAAERALLARTPAHRRPALRALLALAVRRIPLRGRAKTSYLQGLDVARAAARRIGELHTETGRLADPEDAFFFTADELIAGLGDDARELATERRRVYDQLTQIDLATAHWAGDPGVRRVAADDAGSAATGVIGIGASGGIAEGVVRYVEDPAFADVDEGEIIVCTTTDPSWASVLFLAAALVVDIGGLLSHAAVVARELGVPCVIGTGDGTAVLRTGDRIRVDGNAGTVEILARGQRPAAVSAV